MQHRKLLELVEADIESMDLDYLKRVRLLLQSDLWTVGSYLDDREKIEPDRIAELVAERNRLKGVIVEIGRRILEFAAVK